MLHKWSLNASDMATTSIGIGVCKISIFLFGERILLDFGTLDVGLSNSMTQLMKLRRCMFNNVFSVNHCNCSSQHRCIYPTLLFPFKCLADMLWY